jgi:hypothetical protein
VSQTVSSEFSRVLLVGLSFGVSFNVVTALVGSTAAAAVGAFEARRGVRMPWWIAVAVAAWLIGEGPDIAARAGSVVAGRGILLPNTPGWAGWVLLVSWAVSGLIVGYLAPAGLGVAVGRRVTFGTGWLAAVAVAGTVCLAFSAMSAQVTQMLRLLAM